MASFGLLPEGFVPQTTPVIRGEIEEDLRSSFGRSLPLGDFTLLGHIIGILSERLGLLWELLEAVNASQDPDKAVRAALEALCKLTATFKILAASSTAVLTLCGADGTVVAAGNLVSVLSTAKRFTTLASGTIAALAAWVPTTGYAVDQRVTNLGRCYICITAGISAGVGGPGTTAADIVDGTVHWKYLGEGAGAVDVLAAALETGSIVAVAGDITVIETPVGGWETVVNLKDAKLGREEQTDESLRLLRESELSQPGTGPADAIRAAMLLLEGVIAAKVFFNNTDDVDADGLTPHSTEVLVQGGDNQAIWNALWANVPVGIRTIGTLVGTALDAEGLPQTMRFSRPTEIPIYIIVTLIKDPRSYGGDAAVQAQIATWGSGQATGKDVVASAISARTFQIAGVLDVTSVKIGIAPAPGASITIPISLRELATYDTTRITVNSTNGVP